MTPKMCDKAAYTYHSIIQFLPDSFKNQELCDKAFNKCFFEFTYIADRYKTQEMCNRAIFEDAFMLIYYTDEAVDNCLAAFKPITVWFVTSKMLENIDNVLHSNDEILFYKYDFDKVIFIAFQRHILSAELDKINLDNDNDFDEDDPDTVIHVILLAWHRKNKKELKKEINEYLILKMVEFLHVRR